MGPKQSQSEIDSIRKTLEMVDFIQNQGGATIAELVEVTGLSKSSVYKHLNTLSNRGYITKSGKEYHIGLQFFHRGEYARSRKYGYKMAAEAVQELANETNEEVDFLVENNGRMLSIYESHHPENPYGDNVTQPSGFREFSGLSYHMHTVAPGKATLATYSQEKVEMIIDQYGLPAQTEQTITSKQALFEELEQVREQGYAYSDEEFADGLRSIGVIVTDADESKLGGLSISGPTYRMTGEKYNEDLPQLLEEKKNELETDLRGRARAKMNTDDNR